FTPVQRPSPSAQPHLPSTSQTPERQTRPASSALHGPSPLARPQRWSAASQTPARQTAAPTAGVHCPPSGGSWPPIVGMGAPSSSLAVQVPAPVSQKSLSGQSPSTTQAFAAMQTPATEQRPLRQTRSWMLSSQLPPPSAQPQRPSAGSQTPE